MRGKTRVKESLKLLFFLLFACFACVKIHAVEGADWYAATLNAAFEGRHSPVALEYDGKMWIVGGTVFPGIHTNDVWWSVNGADWYAATRNADFTGRNTTVFLDFLGSMWVIAGSGNGFTLHDSWYSNNGVSWTCAQPSCAFEPREATTGVVFDDGTGSKMWVVGGFDGGYTFFADAWYSSNGVDWYAATRNAAFGPIRTHSVLAYSGRMWEIAGNDGTHFNNRVWWTSNGADWYLATGNAAFTPRCQQASAVYNGKMWIVGGMEESGTKVSDVWWSTNGADWYEATGNAAFGGRDTQACLDYDNKLWGIAGYPLSKEVWYTGDEKTPTVTPSLTVSLTPPATRTATDTPTITPTITASSTPPATYTETATLTATPTLTPVPTPYPQGVRVIYPNPYNPLTAYNGTLKVKYVEPGSGFMLYTVIGEYVTGITATTAIIEWDGRNGAGIFVSDGVYYYVLKDPDGTVTETGKIFVVYR